MIGFCKEQWVKNEGTLRDVLSIISLLIVLTMRH